MLTPFREFSHHSITGISILDFRSSIYSKRNVFYRGTRIKVEFALKSRIRIAQLPPLDVDAIPTLVGESWNSRISPAVRLSIFITGAIIKLPLFFYFL